MSPRWRSPWSFGAMHGARAALALAGLAACGACGADRPTEPLRGVDPARVRTISINAPSSTIFVGDSVRLSITATDSTGAVIATVQPTWRTLEPRVSVTALGTVWGVEAGAARVEAAVGSVRDTVALQVQVRTMPPLVPGFTHEPLGMTLISEEGWSTFPGTWSYQQKWGSARVVDDATAPIDASVLEFVFQNGLTGRGESPAAMRMPVFPDPAGTRNFREMYWGFYWKANAEWQNHQSNINKILFGWQNNSALWGLTWHWGPVNINGRVVSKHLSLFQGGSYAVFNTPGAFSIEPGAWYKVEMYYRPSSTTGAADGVLRVWVNDVLCSEHTTLRTTAGYISDLYFDPTWGGVSEFPKTRDDYFRIAHTRVSAR